MRRRTFTATGQLVLLNGFFVNWESPGGTPDSDDVSQNYLIWRQRIEDSCVMTAIFRADRLAGLISMR